MGELVVIGVVILALTVLVAVLSRRNRLRDTHPAQVSASPGTSLEPRPPTPAALTAPTTAAPGPTVARAPRLTGQPGLPGQRAQLEAAGGPDNVARTSAEPAELLGSSSSTSAPPRDPFRPPARLFAMGDLTEVTAGGYRHLGPYAAVAISATGFTPMRDRIIEIAVVSTDRSGRVVEEFSSLLDPQGAGVGPTFLHGIEDADLVLTPTFADIAGEVLTRLEGRVVVAHNAELVEQFLAAEFLAAGLLVPSLPAINVFRLGQRIFATRNQRLATLAAHLHLPERPGESALGDARLVAGMLSSLLTSHGRQLAYPVPPPPSQTRRPSRARAVARPRQVDAASPDQWLTAVLARVSMSASEANDPRIAAYLEALTSILGRGRIVSTEARELTRLLAAAGHPASRIRDILERLLESLRQAAFEERKLSTAQLSHLRAAAASVGIPTYFDDLIPAPTPPAPPPGSGSFARPVRKPLPVAPPAWLARCGHCLSTGHYTTSCPRLAGGRSVGPVAPISPIDRI